MTHTTFVVLLLSTLNLCAQNWVDSLTGPNWRTSAVKDTDGDLKYGTDGYLLFGWNADPGQYLVGPSAAPTTDNPINKWVRPSYISGITTISPKPALWTGSVDGNYGFLQDPDNLSSTKPAKVWVDDDEVLKITINRQDPTVMFRLTLIFGGGDGGKYPADSQTINVVFGGVGLISTHTGTSTNGVSYFLVDVPARPEPIVITIDRGGDGDRAHLTGLAFDTLMLPVLTVVAEDATAGEPGTGAGTGTFTFRENH